MLGGGGGAESEHQVTELDAGDGGSLDVLVRPDTPQLRAALRATVDGLPLSVRFTASGQAFAETWLPSPRIAGQACGERGVVRVAERRQDGFRGGEHCACAGVRRDGPGRGSWLEAGERWRRLEVSFPPDVHTHSRRQTFYVDAAGLIRRHDYVARPVGRWARAAHYYDGHRPFAGLVLPAWRRVRPRGPGGRALPHPILVALDIDHVEIET